MSFSVSFPTVISSLEAQELVTVNRSGLSLFPFHTPAFIHSPLRWISKKITRERKRRCNACSYHLLFSLFGSHFTGISHFTGWWTPTSLTKPKLHYFTFNFDFLFLFSSFHSVFSLRWLYLLLVYSLSSRSCTMKVSFLSVHWRVNKSGEIQSLHPP